MGKNLPPSLDTWTTIFLFAAIHGLVLAALLFSNKNSGKKANFWLGIFILFFSLTLIDYVGYWSRYNIYFTGIRGFYELLTLFFGPLLFFYFKVLYTNELRRVDYLHFAPAFLFILLKKVLGWEVFFPSLPIYYILEPGLFLLHLILYGAICWRFLFSKRLFAPFEKWKNHKTVLWLYWGYVAGWAAYFFLVSTPYFTLAQDYSISFAMTAFIYAVGYLGLRRQTFLTMEDREVAATQAVKYQYSTLTQGASQAISKKILAYMETGKPYLDNELRAGKLADEIGISIHHLSQVLNEELGKNFAELVNEYRVKEAIKLLKDPKLKDSFIIDLAYRAGFNNKTTFNKVFKQETGLSPSDFRKKMLGHQNGFLYFG